MLKNMKVGPKLLLCNIGIIVIMTVFMSVSGYYIPKEMLIVKFQRTVPGADKTAK